MTASKHHHPVTSTHYCYCNDCRMKAKKYLDDWADMIFSKSIADKEKIKETP